MRIRPTARLLVVDTRQRLLLIKVDDGRALHDKRPDMIVYWVTPGGGVEPNETFEQAAERELWEETGLRVAPLGPCIWHHERILHMQQGSMLLQERFFLARVPTSEVSLANLMAYEQQTHHAYHWWAIDEIAQSDEYFLPSGLAHLLQPILDGHIPIEPCRVSS